MGGFRERVHGETLRQLELGDNFSLGLKQDDGNWVLLVGTTNEGSTAIHDQKEIPVSDDEAGWLLRKYESGPE